MRARISACVVATGKATRLRDTSGTRAWNNQAWPSFHLLDSEGRVVLLREAEALVLRSPYGALRLRFSAAQLHLVAAAPESKTIWVRVDGVAPSLHAAGGYDLR